MNGFFGCTSSLGVANKCMGGGGEKWGQNFFFVVEAFFFNFFSCKMAFEIFFLENGFQFFSLIFSAPQIINGRPLNISLKRVVRLPHPKQMELLLRGSDGGALQTLWLSLSDEAEPLR